MSFTRIIQVTDIHLANKPNGKALGLYPEACFRQVISDVLSLDKPADLVLATGDLANDGSCEAYTRLREMFLEFNIPVFVIPGNHDCVENMKSSLVMNPIRMEQQTEIGGWKIVFLNSQVIDAEHGFIDADGFAQLHEAIDVAGNQPLLIALHHSLTPECGTSGCQLTNAEELLSLCSEHGNIKAMISGHTHCQTEQDHAGIKLLTTPSTFLHVTHAKPGESEDHENFMMSHSFDAAKYGY